MRVLSLFGFCLMMGSASAQDAAPLAAIDALLKPYEQIQSPGMSVGIVQNGKLIYAKGFGLADIEKQIKNNPSTVFSVASVAKQFTAACIWSLIQEGKLNLEDDIRKFLPEFPDYGVKILIRQMLNHTSGIRNYHALMALAGFDYDTRYHDNQTILQLACKQKGLNNIPGEKVIYGNTAYTLLAIIVERVSGKDLNAYAQEHLFHPLGMHHTFFRTDSTLIVPHKAIGYYKDDIVGFARTVANQLTYGAGSMGSTIEDLAIWSNVLNGRNEKFKNLTDFLTAVETLANGEKAKYARGVMVDQYKGYTTIHHSGYSQGGQSQIIALPELKLALVLLTNNELIAPEPLSYQLLEPFLPAKESHVAQPMPSTPIKKAPQDLISFTGTFQEQQSDMKMTITMDLDTLRALGSQGKKTVNLVALDGYRFTRANNSSVVYDFTPDAQPGVQLVVYFGGTPFYFARAKFIDPLMVQYAEYAGHYTSEELGVGYHFFTEGNELFLEYPGHSKVKLMPGQKDEFGNGQRVLYQFKRNLQGTVTGLLLSAEGTVKEIRFVRN